MTTHTAGSVSATRRRHHGRWRPRTLTAPIVSKSVLRYDPNQATLTAQVALDSAATCLSRLWLASGTLGGRLASIVLQSPARSSACKSDDDAAVQRRLLPQQRRQRRHKMRLEHTIISQEQRQIEHGATTITMRCNDDCASVAAVPDDDDDDRMTAGHTKRISNVSCGGDATWHGQRWRHSPRWRQRWRHERVVAGVHRWKMRFTHHFWYSPTDRLTGNRIPPFGVLVNRLSVKNTLLNLVKVSRNEASNTYMKRLFYCVAVARVSNELRIVLHCYVNRIRKEKCEEASRIALYRQDDYPSC